ncbi:MAG: translation elongation factor Ts [Gammaproteobacteria bacterium]
MTNISASMVKELREKTNVGMMECKKALEAAGGNIEQAIEALRKAGQAKAVKKSDRVAAEGSVVIATSPDAKRAVILETNCETDFVGRSDDFRAFAKDAAALALSKEIKSLEDLSSLVDAGRLELIAKLGENINLRRMEYLEVSEGMIGSYLHGDTSSSRIAALVLINSTDATLAKDLAMQVAAMNPEYLNMTDIPAERLDKERSICLALAQEQNPGKAAEMIEKITEGKLKKWASEICLHSQAFVKNDNQNIEQLLKSKQTQVQRYLRMAVGEGIEKQVSNFAEEVRAQTEAFAAGTQ